MKKGILAVVGLVSALATGAALAVGPWSSAVNVSQIEIDSVADGSAKSVPSGCSSCAAASKLLKACEAVAGCFW